MSAAPAPAVEPARVIEELDARLQLATSERETLTQRGIDQAERFRLARLAPWPIEDEDEP